MRSVFAALRSLVLPAGATSPPRIVIDGVNARILVAGADGSEIEMIAGAGATLEFSPETTQGNTWTPGVIESGIEEDPPASGVYFGLTIIRSAQDAAGTPGFQAETQWWGASEFDDYSAIKDTCLAREVNTDLFDVLPFSNDGVELRVDNNPVRTRVGVNQNTSSTGTFTAETVTDTITVSVVQGFFYTIEWNSLYNSSVADDTVQWRIREDNISGTQVHGTRTRWNSTLNMGVYVRGIYQAASTGSKTFVITGIRAAGTGNITRFGAATSPSIITVDCTGQT